MSEKKINDRIFKVEPLLATKSMLLKARILKLLGPAAARLGEILAGAGGNKGEEDEKRSNGAALAAIGEILTGMDPEDMTELVKDVCEIAMIRRPSGVYDRVDFDGDFTGHDADIVPVILFVLKEQFGAFFTALPAFGSLRVGRPN